MEAVKPIVNKIDTALYERWFHRIVSHWHLFLIAGVLAFAACYTYLRYTLTVYSVSATVLVKDASQNINPLDPSMMRGGDMASAYRTYNLNNEIKIFQSKRLIEETVKNMDWAVNYYIEGNFKNSEIYKFNLFRISYSDSANHVPYGKKINLKILPDYKFKLSFREDEDEKILPLDGEYSFNTPYTVGGFVFAVNTSAREVDLPVGKVYIMKMNTLESVVFEYLAKVRVMQYDKNSSILSVNSQGTCVEKEKDFVNNHCASFVKISLNDKNITQERTIGFIDAQLGVISDTLAVLESRMILFRKKFNSANIEGIAEKRFAKLEALEDEKAKYELNLRYFQYLKEYLSKKSDYTDIVAPATIGINDPFLNQLLQQLIELKLKQNTMFKTDNPNSPFKIDNENKINQIKKNIIEVIQNIESSNTILNKDITARIDQVLKMTSNILDNERNYIELKRKYKINEELYNILLKKKSELAITRAGNVSDTKIIDYAFVSGAPHPIASKIYGTYIILALLLPLLYVVLKYVTNYKILDKEDVTYVCPMPYLGAVGNTKDEIKLVLISKPKSAIAEAFRSIRANLYFFLPNPQQKVILITSSLSGEGKTFTSVNIASVLALSNKKVVLIGADLRKPKVYLNLQTRGKAGLSNYLVNKADIDEIIIRTEHENYDFIPAGSVPPNPAELLTSEQVGVLFQELRKRYDYIIVDTPPIGLVTDALPLMRYSDLNIYLVRHNYTQTRFLKQLAEMMENGAIKNMVYILNDYEASKNYGLGYKYGYYRSQKDSSGYYDEEESSDQSSVWGRIKSIFGKKA